MRMKVLYLSQADKPLPCPPPHEEIIKQNVINPEAIGGNDIISEMIVVKILIVCHLLSWINVDTSWPFVGRCIIISYLEDVYENINFSQ